MIPTSFDISLRKTSSWLTDLLWSEIIADGILETLADPLLGYGGEVAFSQNVVNYHDVLVARL